MSGVMLHFVQPMKPVGCLPLCQYHLILTTGFICHTCRIRQRSEKSQWQPKPLGKFPIAMAVPACRFGFRVLTVAIP